MNLATAFQASTRCHAEKPAVFWGEKVQTYSHIANSAQALAMHLVGHFCVRPGDRVGLWLKNCPEFVPSVFGILLAGGVVVPINNFLKSEEVGYILEDAGLDVLITNAELGLQEPALQAQRPGLRLFKVEELGSLPSRGNPLPETSARENDLAVIIYTSGTTGRPKGAMLSHHNLLHNVESCRRVLEATGEDRFVVILPLFHTYMMCVGLMLPMLTGGSMILIRSLHPPKNMLQEIYQHRGTILPAIPQFYRSLTQATIPAGMPLRICISGAAPLPQPILEEFESKFGIPLIEGYGLSEASPVVTKNPLRGIRKAGSIGLPIPEVEVSVQDDSGKVLDPGETGEICVRGGNVMIGYWNKPEETAKVMREGWLLTGDVGHRDEDGYFYITDRKKDMLLVNGINVYPREIEEVLYRFPGVKEAAAIGVPDARRGEQPIAFVAPLDEVTLDEKALHQFLRAKLADYKVPRRIEVLSALPRNATGKILKTALRDLKRPLEADSRAF
jgi:long-chain acyl-CoA synthetase